LWDWALEAISKLPAAVDNFETASNEKNEGGDKWKTPVTSLFSSLAPLNPTGSSAPANFALG
jgi:hypothetical protein